LSISEVLAKNNPKDAQAQRDLMVALEHVGKLFRESGDDAGALTSLVKASSAKPL